VGIELAHKLLFEKFIESVFGVGFFIRSLVALKQFVEAAARVIGALRFGAAFVERYVAVGVEVIAKIIAHLVAHVFSLRLGALIVLARIEETAILATVHFGFAMGAFVAAKDFADDFVIASAIVTNHIRFVAQDAILCHTLLSIIKSGVVGLTPKS
jgi:hypothetical protein